MTREADPSGPPAARAGGAPSAHRPGSEPAPALELIGLRHRYADADRDALAGVDLVVDAGEAFALLGPNGGGKSTAFRVAGTLLVPTAGTALVFGHDVRTAARDARAALGPVFQHPAVDVQLTATENLVCHARLHGMPRRDAARRAAELLERFGLSDRARDRLADFSGGMSRRVEIAKALLPDPRLLLMDEPATGLDPAARRDLWTLLHELRRERGLTVVWTTHLLDEAEHADRVGVLAGGRLLTVDTPAAVRDAGGGPVLTVEPADPARLPDVRERLHRAFAPGADRDAADSATVAPPRIDGLSVRFEHAGGPAAVSAVAELLHDVELRRLTVGRPSLEDAYLRLDPDAAAADDAALDDDAPPASRPTAAAPG